MTGLRWNPLLGDWLATATDRQERTFLLRSDFCPLCSTKEGGCPTEVPESNYDIVVFLNRFPSLSPDPPSPSVVASKLYLVRPGLGACEVIAGSETVADMFINDTFGRRKSC